MYQVKLGWRPWRLDFLLLLFLHQGKKRRIQTGLGLSVATRNRSLEALFISKHTRNTSQSSRRLPRHLRNMLQTLLRSFVWIFVCARKIDQLYSSNNVHALIMVHTYFKRMCANDHLKYTCTYLCGRRKRCIRLFSLLHPYISIWNRWSYDLLLARITDNRIRSYLYTG